MQSLGTCLYLDKCLCWATKTFIQCNTFERQLPTLHEFKTTYISISVRKVRIYRIYTARESFSSNVTPQFTFIWKFERKKAAETVEKGYNNRTYLPIQLIWGCKVAGVAFKKDKQSLSLVACSVAQWGPHLSIDSQYNDGNIGRELSEGDSV